MTDAQTHVYRHEPEFPVERELLARHVSAGAATLDVGTAATGRSALLCQDLGAVVTSIDYNHAAVEAFAADSRSDGIALASADMTSLPFDDEVFDVVLVGFHGFDYLTSAEARSAAFAELARVARPNGRVIINCWNRIGIATRVRWLFNSGQRGIWLSWLRRGGPFRHVLHDTNGLELWQESVGATVRAAGGHGLDLVEVCELHSGRTTRWRVALTAPEPYFVFTRR